MEMEQKIARILPELHRKNMNAIKTGDVKVFRETSTVLADARDYFHWQVVNCKDKTEAKTLIDNYDKYMAQYENEGLDSKTAIFYTGFFFALTNILTLRFQISGLPGEKLSYADFERSFKETKKYMKD